METLRQLLHGTPLEIIPGATLAGLISGALLPLLGLWVVMQRVVFLGVTLAQVAAAGVALALFLHLPPLPLGLVLALAVVVVFARPGGAAQGDSTLGALFCAASALALLFISRSPADMDQVQHVLHGNLIYATGADVVAVGATLVAALLVTWLCFRRLLFAAFDGPTAAALGLRARGWLLLLFGVLALVLTVSMRTTGSLLTFAMLVLPPLAALQLGRGLAATFLLSSALGLVGTAAGLLLAVSADLHLESSIVLVLVLLLPLARAWRIHPLLALALAAAGTFIAPWLRPATETVHGSEEHHELHAPTEGVGHAALAVPFHVDVHLSTRRLSPEEALVSWTLELHRDDPQASLPPAVWLVLPVGEGYLEQALIEDTAVLPPGDVQRAGDFRLALPAAGTLDGTLWSGPVASGEPLPSAVVIVAR